MADPTQNAAAWVGSAASTSWLRFLVKAHSYLGLGLSVFVLLLFFSGIVMMFTGYPRYYDTHRLPDMPGLGDAVVNVSVQQAYAQTGLESAPANVRLNVLQDRPAYRFEAADGSYRIVFADNGQLVKDPGPGFARDTVESFVAANDIDGAIHAGEKMTDVDAWTTNPGFSGTSHWPFYKFELGDSDGTQLYVSSETAEVVHKTAFWQRFWGYAGPVIHYFYVPINLRQLPDYWFGVVVVISGIGTFACLFGLIIGATFIRWRQLARWLTGQGKTRRLLPFKGWLYWHNLFGLVFGLLAFTWLFSGMLSMNPFSMESSAPAKGDVSRWTAGPLSLAGLQTTFEDALHACQREIDVREIRLRQIGGDAYYYCLASPTDTRLVLDGTDKPRVRFSAEALESKAPLLIPAGSVISAFTWLEDYDSYYNLGRSERIGDQVKRLPVARVAMNDDKRSAYYIDPYSGSLVLRMQTESRVHRWLFDGLHTFDFAWLHEHRRTLWWTVMTVFMAGGLALSATSVWLTVQWMRKTTRPREKANENMQ